jgi:plastocyanin
MENLAKTFAICAVLALGSPALAQEAAPDTAAPGQSPGSVDAPPTKMEITAKDFTFNPDRIVVSRGQNIDLTMTNEGSARHSVGIKLPDAEVKFSDPVDPGSKRTLSFKAPERAGEYEIYCPMGNHRERGMSATLVVK